MRDKRPKRIITARYAKGHLSKVGALYRAEGLAMMKWLVGEELWTQMTPGMNQKQHVNVMSDNRRRCHHRMEYQQEYYQSPPLM